MDAGLRTFIREEDNYPIIVAKETVQWQNSNTDNKVYLYGAGYLCQYYVRYLQANGIHIEKILDREKCGEYKGIPICRYDEFLKEAPEPSKCRFFIATAKYVKEVRIILEKTFLSHNIFFVEWAFQFEYNDFSLDEYRQYLDDHWEELMQLDKSLADNLSKQTLDGILREHVSGNPRYIENIISPNLGFPDDIMQFKKNEIFVELGANNGDTFKSFIKTCPGYRAAWLFEPEDCYQPILMSIRDEETKKRKTVHIIKKGAWDKDDIISFLSTSEGSGTVIERELEGVTTKIEMTTIDKTISDVVTFIKMDIEGAELKALRGAAHQIKTNRPKLAVCVYHKCVDLLEIWHFLHSLVPDYRFYLRAHTPLWDDIYLYAV